MYIMSEDNHTNAQTENTDLLVNMLADTQKLVSTDQRVMYNNMDDKLDDNLDGYKTEKHRPDPEPKHDNHNNHDNNDHHDQDDDELTGEELLLKKLEMLRKLGELVQRGVKLSQNYNLNSSYKMMKYEYELHSGIRSKQNAINWMGGMMIGLVQGLELLNDYVNPFEISFDNAWSNKVKNNITDYYEVLGEIYEKYAGSGKTMAPELKIFMMLTGSALTIQMHRGIANLGSKDNNENNNNNNNENDNDQIRELRQRATKDEELEQAKKQKAYQEKVEQEHYMATMKAMDLQRLQNAKNEINKLSRNEQLNQSLLLSETAKSHHSAVDTQIKQQLLHEQQQLIREQQHMQEQLQEQQELVQQFNKLNDIRSRINQMKQQSVQQIEHVSENKPVLNKVSEKAPLKKSSEKTLSAKSSEKPPKKQLKVEKDSISVSSSSTASVKINPNLGNIINKVKKENEITINNNKLQRITYQKDSSSSSDEQDDIRESISLAKSNKSPSNGGKKKPRKTLKLTTR